MPIVRTAAVTVIELDLEETLGRLLERREALQHELAGLDDQAVRIQAALRAYRQAPAAGPKSDTQVSDGVLRAASQLGEFTARELQSATGYAERTTRELVAKMRARGNIVDVGYDPDPPRSTNGGRARPGRKYRFVGSASAD